MMRVTLISLCLLALFALPVCAEEKKEDPIPPMGTAEDAAEALAAFKVDFKARGFKGEEKIGEQDFALRKLAKTQHWKVADALAKATKHRSIDLRTSAVLQLGEQRALPGYAGKFVVEAMKRNGKDATFQMAGLEAIGKLRYLGAEKQVLELMKHHDYAVVKNAFVTIGKLADHRFIEEIVKLMKALKLEKGAKWDGVNVTYDTGTAGDHDQKMAEKIAKAQMAKNKRKGKRAAKSMRDLGPVILEVMYELTGEQFTGGIAARKWLGENRKKVDGQVKVLKDAAAEQQADAKALKKKK